MMKATCASPVLGLLLALTACGPSEAPKCSDGVVEKTVGKIILQQLDNTYGRPNDNYVADMDMLKSAFTFTFSDERDRDYDHAAKKRYCIANIKEDYDEKLGKRSLSFDISDASLYLALANQKSKFEANAQLADKAVENAISEAQRAENLQEDQTHVTETKEQKAARDESIAQHWREHYAELHRQDLQHIQDNHDRTIKDILSSLPKQVWSPRTLNYSVQYTDKGDVYVTLNE